MTGDGARIEAILKTFAKSVQSKLSALAVGEPEEQLRAPAETLLQAAGTALGKSVLAAPYRAQLRGLRPALQAAFEVAASAERGGERELDARVDGRCDQRGSRRRRWSSRRASTSSAHPM